MTRQSRTLLPGTVDLVILQTLTQGPFHGFEVSRSIRARSGGTLELQDAALYQALHRMERAGWVESEWGISDKGRRAKYYQLTRAGRRQLESEVGFWRRYAAALRCCADAVVVIVMVTSSERLGVAGHARRDVGGALAPQRRRSGDQVIRGKPARRRGT